MAAKVEVKAKHDMKKIRRLAALKGKRAVLVGVLRGTGEHPSAEIGSGITIAWVAWQNEFGNKRIPSRPFLRTTLRENGYYREHLKAALQASLIATVKFETNIEGPLKKVGAVAASDIRKKIVDGTWVPNADSTIRKKSRGAKGEDLDAYLGARAADWDLSKVSLRGSGIKNKPLIDTGIMRQSIQWALGD